MHLPLLVELGFWGTLAADVIGWAVVHAGTGYVAHRLPDRRLENDHWLLRVRRFEPRAYRALRVQRWKDRLPEAGALFAGGIDKRRLPTSVETFVRETRRAELAHWWALMAAPVFALWNPLSGVVLMVTYGLAVNAPFIVIQRYNRHRAQRLLARRASTAPTTGSEGLQGDA